MRRLLAFLAALLAPAAMAQTFTGSMSGAWWNPARPGEGQVITFETVGTRSVAYFSYFTYTPQGAPSWLVGSADYEPGAASIDIPLGTGSGAKFGQAFRSADVTIAAAGTVRLEYVSCTQMRMRYSGIESFTLDLARLIGPLNGVDCPNGAPPPRTGASTFGGPMSGSWWNPARAGEGQFISFESVNGRNVVFFTYFTYDANGAASWLVGNTDYRTGAASISIPLYRTSGARFGTAFRASDVALTPAGHAILDHLSCSQMRLRYTGTESIVFNIARLVGPLSGADCAVPEQAASPADAVLRSNNFFNTGQTGNAGRQRVVPSIADPLPQLGKLLFFSKALSGRLDTACASCHHPTLGGADGLSLPIGVGAANPHLLGPGRTKVGGSFSLGRNSQTFFNVAIFDSSLFWDQRIESLGSPGFDNGAGAPIRTPDTPIRVGDPRAGTTLPAALSRFPIPAQTEMRGDAYPGLDDEQYRARIAARLGNYGAGAGELAPSRWLERFRAAFGSQRSASELITFDNIAMALGEYMRSAVFVDNPWSRYVRGDNSAVSEEAKRGATTFFRPVASGGAECARCHVTDFFSIQDRRHAAFPQIGIGAGDGPNGTDDLGRMRQTNLESDRYKFRVPSLLNVELTAPYGHAGVFGDLESVVTHYLSPETSVNEFVAERKWCNLPQFVAIADCASAAPDVSRNSLASLAQLPVERTVQPGQAVPRLDHISPGEVPFLVAFLKTLTDPCLRDRACYGRWIPAPDEAPDAHQLDAIDASGSPL